MEKGFLPITAQEIKELGWERPDFVYVCGDAYVDHPSFGAAIITRVLEAAGFRIAFLAQPDYKSCEEFKKFADPALISKLKNGMNTEEVKSILGASPIELGNNIDTFMFTDGRVVYVSKGSGGSLEYDNSIAPDLVDQIKIGDSYSDVTQKLRANGVQPYNRYGCIGYCLSDGRKLHIEFTPDNFVESFSVSDH